MEPDVKARFKTAIDEMTPEKIFDGRTHAECADRIGQIIDCADLLQSEEGFSCGLRMIELIRKRSLTPDLDALMLYYEANAHAGLHCLRRHGKPEVWEWKQPDLENAIICLRRAIGHDGFRALGDTRQCQIFTNLANQLNHLGRTIEAIELHDRALILDRNFSMALGNKGLCLSYYARLAHSDENEDVVQVLFRHAVRAIENALALQSGLAPDHRRGFEATLENLRQVVPREIVEGKDDPLEPPGNDVRSRFRHWCAVNRLYLNPINDLGKFTTAAEDRLHLPPVFIPKNATPSPPHGFYNQIKQQYVAARFALWRYHTGESPCLADEGVFLSDTLDYPAYGLYVEDLRSAFRLAYSVFDQLASFLNIYLCLGLKENRVSFRSVWHENGDPRKDLATRFVNMPNPALRGLYWLSRDVAEGPSDANPDGSALYSSLEPDAQALVELRNHIEHKYLKLHGLIWTKDRQPCYGGEEPARHEHLNDFHAKTLRLLKLVRAAIIYTTLAVHVEEGERREKSPAPCGKIVVPIILTAYNPVSMKDY